MVYNIRKSDYVLKKKMTQSFKSQAGLSWGFMILHWESALCDTLEMGHSPVAVLLWWPITKIKLCFQIQPPEL